MKFHTVIAIFLIVAGLSSAQAQQEADDQYIFIYSLIQQADTLAGSGRLPPALEQYTAVQGELQKFKTVFPDWNPKIVSFRLNYLAGKIAGLTAQLPVPQPPATTNTTPESAVADGSHGQIQALLAANATLQAKLKEALAAQPATIDARALVKSQEKIRSLMKENELLKVSVAQGKDRTNTVNSDALDALRAENELLKKQSSSLKIAAAASLTSAARLEADLKQAQLQVAALQSDAQVRALEKTALENRLNKISGGSVISAPVPLPVPAADQSGNEARIRELTQERNNLLAELGAANRELYGFKNQSAAAQIGDLNSQIKTLRARLAVDEALAVPYTPEELEMFRQPAPQPPAPDLAKKSIKELPAGSAPIVAEAQRYFAARQYDKAEDNYQKILQRDENNPIVLGNLAAIELEQGKLAEAEKHLATAVAKNPDDAYNLSLLGHLKFRQGKYDDALDALSRAAKLDPQNPEIQNYLGVTLSHKGLRVQAETALRQAIQMAPNYADAHNNLAVIYINQQPPLVQLARWHYQKALAAGQPPNPKLEKALGGTVAPGNPR